MTEHYQLYSAELNGEKKLIAGNHPSLAAYGFEDHYGFSPDVITLERYLTNEELLELQKGNDDGQ
jgi:hypothetical protein